MRSENASSAERSSADSRAAKPRDNGVSRAAGDFADEAAEEAA